VNLPAEKAEGGSLPVDLVHSDESSDGRFVDSGQFLVMFSLK
jgi:hypothetical protein